MCVCACVCVCQERCQRRAMPFPGNGNLVTFANVAPLFLAIPEHLSTEILKSGYTCKVRRNVPVSASRASALKACKQYCSGNVAVLVVNDVPQGVGCVTSGEDCNC